MDDLLPEQPQFHYAALFNENGIFEAHFFSETPLSQFVWEGRMEDLESAWGAYCSGVQDEWLACGKPHPGDPGHEDYLKSLPGPLAEADVLEGWWGVRTPELFRAFQDDWDAFASLVTRTRVLRKDESPVTEETCRVHWI